MTTIPELIARIDAHETEGENIQILMTELGLDQKKVKAIRKAEKAADEAKVALAKLMGEGG
jgi:hypothetical protein